MKQILVFRTKFNNHGDYDGFEFFNSEYQFTMEDKAKILEVAERFYQSGSTSIENLIDLSIGKILIKGAQHPSVARMKSLEGLLREDDIVQSKKIVSDYDVHIKDVFVELLTKLFQLHVDSTNPREKELSQLFMLLVNQLNQDALPYNGRYLLHYNLQFLADTIYKDNKMMEGILIALQSIHTQENIS